MDSRGEEFGPYRVYEQIGAGGMATVHRAETSGIAGFRKTVALKRMLPHVATNADLVKSFVREARLASHLRHGNVAQTYDLGKVGDIYFIAMELVTGHNLREILRHCARVQIRIPIPITLHILNQICDALDYAHNLCDDSGQPFGIIHRDVSPANVIVSESGTVKLIDFGIAKASAAGMQTMSGTIKGKFGYMAPEYLAGTIDARADLFALGIIAYELLTNRPLFTGQDDMDTLYRVRSMPVPHPSAANPGVPDEIDAIVMTALERDPEKRWQRAQAMRVALTTETKRLGMTLLDHQVVEWCEWAFQQQPGGFDRESEPSMIVVREPELPSAPMELDDDDPDGLMQTRIRSSSPPPSRAREPTRASAPPAIEPHSHSAVLPPGGKPRPSSEPHSHSAVLPAGGKPRPSIEPHSHSAVLPAGGKPRPSIEPHSHSAVLPAGGKPRPSSEPHSHSAVLPAGGKPRPSIEPHSHSAVLPAGGKPRPSIEPHSHSAVLPAGGKPRPSSEPHSHSAVLPAGGKPRPSIEPHSHSAVLPAGGKPRPSIEPHSHSAVLPPGGKPRPSSALPLPPPTPTPVPDARPPTVPPAQPTPSQVVHARPMGNLAIAVLLLLAAAAAGAVVYFGLPYVT